MFGRSKTRSAATKDLPGLLDAVDQHRERIARLTAEREAIAHAPRPISETLSLLDDHLDALATSGVDALRLGRLTSRGAAISLDLPFHIDRATGAVDGSHASRALLGLLVATNRAAFRQIVEGQLTDLMRDRSAMTDAEQVARLAEVDAERTAVELREESAIRQLERSGLPVLRRPDASPVALLVADDALPAA